MQSIASQCLSVSVCVWGALRDTLPTMRAVVIEKMVCCVCCVVLCSVVCIQSKGVNESTNTAIAKKQLLLP